MIVYGLVSVVAAVIIAAVALWRRRLPEGLVRRTGRVGLPALRALRSAHSGHIGDYISWVTFGTALLGGLLALAARS